MSAWKLTSDKMEGCILIVYKNDWLYSATIQCENKLSEKQYEYFLMELPVNEYTLRKVGFPGFNIEAYLIPERIPANEKIALFCRMYTQHYQGLKYKADKRDGGMISNYDVSEALLGTYFNSQNFNFKNKHSIRNLVTYFNELRAEHAGLTKSEFPNYYCSELFDWLKGPEKNKYQEHLAKNGITISSRNP